METLFFVVAFAFTLMIGAGLGGWRANRWWSTEVARRNAALAARPARYELPPAPVTGHTIRDKHGRDWIREHIPPSDGYDYRQWGSYIQTIDLGGRAVERLPWWSLLAVGGPLSAVPETAQDKAMARLYGPAGARWGNPDEPCPYSVCVLGLNHVPPHLDRKGHPVKVETDASVLGQRDLDVYCNCGHPEAHLSTCPRSPYHHEEPSDA